MNVKVRDSEKSDAQLVAEGMHWRDVMWLQEHIAELAAEVAESDKFGAVMDRLAQENWATVKRREERIQSLEAALREAERQVRLSGMAPRSLKEAVAAIATRALTPQESTEASDEGYTVFGNETAPVEPTTPPTEGAQEPKCSKCGGTGEYRNANAMTNWIPCPRCTTETTQKADKSE